MSNYPESDLQLLARLLIATREGDALNQQDAQRLNELATYGHSTEPLGAPVVTTMPEERNPGGYPPHQSPLSGRSSD
jgi:hypothetical protein